jgi:hypothetical protein
MDPQMRNVMEAQKQARLQQLEAEMAWELARNTLAHKKLHDRFVACLEQPRFIVKAFQTPDFVSTLRCPAPSKDFLEATFKPLFSISKLKIAAQRASVSLLNRIAQGEGEGESAPATGSPERRQSMARRESTGAVQVMTSRQKLEEAANKSEERKRVREEQKAQRDRLMAEKPNEKHVNPEDLEVGWHAC